jgi:chorismate mutase
MGIDPAVSVPFFRDQIEAGKMVQRGLFRRWRARPDRVPAHRPDLITEVRPQLDRLTKQLLANLRRPECPARIRLDPLHRRALVVAMRSLAHC